MLQGFESLRLTAYQDARGVWVIGYGHTGPEVAPGTLWTPQQASQTLEEDVCWATQAVQQLTAIPLHQNQFDSLVSFTFNVGRKAFGTSTLLHLVNVGNFIGASEQFFRWIYAVYLLSSGLINWRKIEAAMFNGSGQ